MKKGELSTTQIFTIGEIILALSIVAFLYLFSQHVLNDTTFERSVISKDQAFLLNTIQSQPINTKLFYSATNIEKYIFCFRGNKVQIYEDLAKLPIYQPFLLNSLLISNLGYSPENCVEYVNDNLYFEKTAESIIIEDKKLTGKFTCPYKIINTDAILLDPLNDYNTPGEIISDTSKNSYEINSLIINSLYDYILTRKPEQNIEKTRELSSLSLTLDEKQDKITEKDLIIIINTLNSNTEEDFIKIYYNIDSKNSSYFSCKVANQLYLNGLNTYIIPKEAKIQKNSFDLINQSNKTIVYIEIYNKNRESIISDYPKISEAIGNAIIQEIV